MQRVKIHYENVTLDCENGHGPLYFLNDITKKYDTISKNKICVNAICLECGKVSNYVLDKEYAHKNVVFQDGEYLHEAVTSRVKNFYDTSNRYYDIKDNYDTEEEIVEVLNKERKLIK